MRVATTPAAYQGTGQKRQAKRGHEDVRNRAGAEEEPVEVRSRKLDDNRFGVDGGWHQLQSRVLVVAHEVELIPDVREERREMKVVIRRVPHLLLFLFLLCRLVLEQRLALLFVALRAEFDL